MCGVTNPKDAETGRMAEHLTDLGVRCLGGDVPWGRHRGRPAGKLLGCIVAAFPNRTKAIELVRQAPRATTELAIDRLLAERHTHDMAPADWMRALFLHEQMVHSDQLFGMGPPAGELIEVRDWGRALEQRRARRGA